ncbi:MAG: stress-induced morphogen [Bacteriovoracaceae bacterium]|jgi:stress-induced morphogen
MNPLEEIKNLIEAQLAGSTAEVGDMTGTGDHLEILVISDDFKGKLLLDQHQMVMDVLKESLKEKVHAVKIKTITKEKYNQQG